MLIHSSEETPSFTLSWWWSWNVSLPLFQKLVIKVNFAKILQFKVRQGYILQLNKELLFFAMESSLVVSVLNTVQEGNSLFFLGDFRNDLQFFLEDATLIFKLQTHVGIRLLCTCGWSCVCRHREPSRGQCELDAGKSWVQPLLCLHLIQWPF